MRRIVSAFAIVAIIRRSPLRVNQSALLRGGRLQCGPEPVQQGRKRRPLVGLPLGSDRSDDFVCHAARGDRIYVGEIAKPANGILQYRGASTRMIAQEWGEPVRSFGLCPKRDARPSY